MVRAVLEGRKTQTRRIVKPQPRPGRYGPSHHSKPNGLIGPIEGCLGGGDYHVWEGKRATACLTTGGVYVALDQCPYGEPGDVLWVRENWRPIPEHLSQCTGPADIRFAASVGEAEWAISKWRPSIHMPRWACRVRLRLTEIRIERLQQISREDIHAEGCEVPRCPKCGYTRGDCHLHMDHSRCGELLPPHEVTAYIKLWESIHGAGSWELNPWVWVVSFERASEQHDGKTCG